MSNANPILVEVTRGPRVESRHRGVAAVVAADGALLDSWGDVAQPVFPRSAIKPIQALPLIETGAAAAFGLGDAEIALACASHAGEPGHVAVAEGWLARLGLGIDDLACGPHRPGEAGAADDLARRGMVATRLHNNCSGKHLGFLTAACHRGEPVAGYHRRDHPTQRRWIATLAELAGHDLAAEDNGIDGCGIPTLPLPVKALALAMARFPAAAGATRIVAALAAEPFMISGSGRFATEAIAACPGRLVVKGGAEGVYTAALVDHGIGVAVKIDDGAGRAAEAAIAALLARLGAFDQAACTRLARFLVPAVTNWAGDTVGEIRVRLE